jgi:hypothetical protein
MLHKLVISLNIFFLLYYKIIKFKFYLKRMEKRSLGVVANFFFFFF